jgi:hypothetical protein
MRHAVLSLVLGFSFFLTGCDPADSLHPLIPPQEAILDPSLEGDWTAVSEDNSKGSEVLRFSREDPSDLQSRDYSVRLGDCEESVEFLGRLGRIDEELYLDLSPKVELNGNGIHLLQGVYVDPAFVQEQQVVKLNGQLLLEAHAGNRGAEAHGGFHQLEIKASPIHWVFKVELTDKKLRLGYLDDLYLCGLIEDKKTNVDCVREHGLILTAETSQLQQLVAQVAHDPDAFTWLEFEKLETK